MRSTASARRSTARLPRLPLALSALLVGLAVLFVEAAPAEAQQIIRRQTLFDRLFGGPPARQVQPSAPRVRRPSSPRETPSPPRARRSAPPPVAAAPSSPPPEPAKPVVDKLENALAVLVVGDFLASGLAEGLEEAYAESPGVRIVDRANGSSGFVRDDYYDWNAAIRPLLDEVKPAVVVVMIGSNDRQQIVVNGRPERPQTEAWRRVYVSRATSFARRIAAAGIPVIWTGVPPFKSPSMSSDMLAFNDIYKQATEEAAGIFIDIWDGFADENGAFTFTGPDMNGQPVRLRGSDGINLTRPARRKLAFYVEQPLNKLLGAAASPRIGPQELENLPPIVVLGEPGDPSRTRPISLAAPGLDGGEELLGAAPPARTDAGRHISEDQPGRADDFLLNRRHQPQEQEPEETALEGTAPVSP